MISPLYAVTGASGQLGSLAVGALLDSGIPATEVVGVVRSPGKAGQLAARGVELREADYGDEHGLAEALAGVDRLLLVSSSASGQRVAHHVNVIAAAREAGVGRIVYTSMLNADRSSNPLAGEHLATEEALSGSGIPFTALRNGWYTENYLYGLDEQVRSGEILGAAGRGRVSAAARADYAAAAAAALLADQGERRVYELGAASFGMPELAQIITEVTGHPVAYRDLSVDDYVAALREAGTKKADARFIAALDASVARGDLQTQSTDLEHLLGRAPQPPTQVIRQAWAASRAAVHDG